jgi:hypothetical protein
VCMRVSKRVENRLYIFLSVLMRFEMLSFMLFVIYLCYVVFYIRGGGGHGGPFTRVFNLHGFAED